MGFFIYDTFFDFKSLYVIIGIVTKNVTVANTFKSYNHPSKDTLDPIGVWVKIGATANLKNNAVAKETTNFFMMFIFLND